MIQLVKKNYTFSSPHDFISGLLCWNEQLCSFPSFMSIMLYCFLYLRSISVRYRRAGTLWLASLLRLLSVIIEIGRDCTQMPDSHMICRQPRTGNKSERRGGNRRERSGFFSCCSYQCERWLTHRRVSLLRPYAQRQTGDEQHRLCCSHIYSLINTRISCVWEYVLYKPGVFRSN